jgi:ABC-type lipoprotein release transport system permease subunit
MLGSIFSKAAWIVGIGIVTGNLLLMTVVTFASGRIPVAFVVRALMITSGVMLTVGLLACVEPARRALRIHPTDALRHL